jgi:phage shock protein C
MSSYRGPLRRSSTNKMVAGVVGGLSDWLGVNAMIARVVVMLVSYFSGLIPVLVLYVLLWLFIPGEY